MKLPNRIFIKLLIGFWLCSTLIITLIGLLPIMLQSHNKQPIPPHFQQILIKVADRIKQQPNQLTNRKLKHIATTRKFRGKTFQFYLTNDQGHLINLHKRSKTLKRFILLTDEDKEPISYQFKNELIFGPYQFSLNDRTYSLYGKVSDHHPRPWSLFFAENMILTLGLIILFSGIACALLAWHLSKPLRILKQSADALAAGDLTSRVDTKTTKRLDEIGQLAIAFNSMATAIETLVHSQQRLISDISHELRTPLTRLNLALAVARKKGFDSPETERIAYESHQIEQMVTELLDLSRLKLSSLDAKQILNLSDCLSQVIEDAEFEAEQKNRKLDTNIDENIVLALYPKALSRAVENILRNAITYCKNEIYIQAFEDSQNIIIEITDDGNGISNEQDLINIFTPFYRPQTARDRDSGGWGLGLAITKAAIDAHNGQVTAKNLSPNGLNIRITLPK